MYLFFDTETTGIPRNYKAPVSDLANWPRLVQLAWVVADEAGNELSSAEHIVRPEGFVIPNDAAKVHGINTEMALRDGSALSAVLDAVAEGITGASMLVATQYKF